MSAIVILALVGLAAYAIYKIWEGGSLMPKRKGRNACPKCDGHGYWEGLRGKETCNICRGSGKVDRPDLYE